MGIEIYKVYNLITWQLVYLLLCKNFLHGKRIKIESISFIQYKKLSYSDMILVGIKKNLQLYSLYSCGSKRICFYSFFMPKFGGK